MSVRAVFTAPEPHTCPMARWGANTKDEYPYGSILLCEDCGTYWVRKNTYELWVEYWHPVKWWEFRERRLIRKWEWDAEHGGA